MRVAIFLPSLAGGGAERVQLTLATALQQRGYQVDLVLANAVGPLLANVPGSLRVVDLRVRRVAASIPFLVRYLRAERPEVVISALEHANCALLLARKLSGVATKVIATTHNATHAFLGAGGARRTFWRTLMALLYPTADALVAVSQGAADDLSRAIGLERDVLTVIGNPVIAPDFSERAGRPVTHPWFVAGGPPVVVAVGRFVPEKDFATLVSAFAFLRRQTQARLLLLGEGPLRQELEAQVQMLGVAEDVALPGFVPDALPYMARSAVVALSSRSEALPTVLIEALAVGARVVATNCAFGPAEILEDGRLGALVPVGDAEALSQALKDALVRPARRPSPGVVERFGVEGAVGRYERLWARGSPVLEQPTGGEAR